MVHLYSVISVVSRPYVHNVIGMQQLYFCV